MMNWKDFRGGVVGFSEAKSWRDGGTARKPCENNRYLCQIRTEFTPNERQDHSMFSFE
jgi:hypothetical protein